MTKEDMILAGVEKLDGKIDGIRGDLHAMDTRLAVCETRQASGRWWIRTGVAAFFATAAASIWGIFKR